MIAKLCRMSWEKWGSPFRTRAVDVVSALYHSGGSKWRGLGYRRCGWAGGAMSTHGTPLALDFLTRLLKIQPPDLPGPFTFRRNFSSLALVPHRRIGIV